MKLLLHRFRLNFSLNSTHFSIAMLKKVLKGWAAVTVFGYGVLIVAKSHSNQVRKEEYRKEIDAAFIDSELHIKEELNPAGTIN